MTISFHLVRAYEAGFNRWIYPVKHKKTIQITVIRNLLAGYSTCLVCNDDKEVKEAEVFDFAVNKLISRWLSNYGVYLNKNNLKKIVEDIKKEQFIMENHNLIISSLLRYSKTTIAKIGENLR